MPEVIYPSARRILEQHLGCRAPNNGWWRLYWSEGGAELTLYQDGEGPQEMDSIDEAIAMIDGDQPAVLNPGTSTYLQALDAGERERILQLIR